MLVPAVFRGKLMVHVTRGPSTIHGYYTVEGLCNCSDCSASDSVTAVVLSRYEPNRRRSAALIGHTNIHDFRIVTRFEDAKRCASDPCDGTHY